MAEVNKTLYPDVTTTDYYTVTRKVDGNCYAAMPDGLDKTITFNASSSYLHPYKDVRSLNLGYYADSPSSAGRHYYHTDNLIRIALQAGTPQNIGSDRCGTKDIITNGFYNENCDFNALYSAVKWNGVAGRLCCVWAKQFDNTGELPTIGRLTRGTWDQFVEEATYDTTSSFVLIQAFIEDVYCGAPQSTRNNPVRALNLNKEGMAYWTNIDPVSVPVMAEMYHFCVMRPQAIATSNDQFAPGYTSYAANGPDNCWPVYNSGYGLQGWVPGTPFGSNVGAHLLYGIEENFHGQHIYKYDMGGTVHGYTYGINVDEVGGIAALSDYMKRKAACYGILYNTDWKTPDITRQTDLTNPNNVPNMILPIQNSDGYYNGDYLNAGDNIGGTSAQELIEGDKNTPYNNGPSTDDPSVSPIPDVPFHPNAGPIDGDAMRDVELSEPAIKPYGLFNRSYILDSSQVAALGDILTTTDDSVIEAVLDGLKMFGQNPMNAIVDLRLYPFAVNEQPGATPGLARNIYLGNYDTEIFAHEIGQGMDCILYLGYQNIPRIFKNFLDYEPYTQIQLYIPYVGTVELPTAIFSNKTVRVYMIVDFNTGACTAVIYANDIPMLYKSGVIGTEIQVSGDSAASYANGVIGSLLNVAGDVVGAAGGLATGNAAAGISNTINAATDIYKLIDSANAVNWQTAGSTAPNLSNYLPQECYLTIITPRGPFFTDYLPEGGYGEYAQTNGVATAEMSQIKTLQFGLTYGRLGEFRQSEANEPAITDIERDMIKRTINDGFYRIPNYFG